VTAVAVSVRVVAIMGDTLFMAEGVWVWMTESESFEFEFGLGGIGDEDTVEGVCDTTEGEEYEEDREGGVKAR
jgi:hypothetical protein